MVRVSQRCQVSTLPVTTSSRYVSCARESADPAGAVAGVGDQPLVFETRPGCQQTLLHLERLSASLAGAERRSRREASTLQPVHRGETVIPSGRCRRTRTPTRRALHSAYCRRARRPRRRPRSGTRSRAPRPPARCRPPPPAAEQAEHPGFVARGQHGALPVFACEPPGTMQCHGGLVVAFELVRHRIHAAEAYRVAGTRYP